jgi:hypothetical protein
MAGSLKLRVALAAVLFAALALTVGATPANAAIAVKQTGSEATGTGNSIAPTLASSSTAGSLLVAVLTNGNGSVSNAFSGPSGWQSAAGTWQSGNGRVDILYYPNNPGGITSVTFSVTDSGGAIMGQLSEWTGADFSSPLDVTGANTCSSTTTCTVTTSSSTSMPGDLGITVFTTMNSPTSYGAGSGWTHMFTDPTNQLSVADRRLSLAQGGVSETESDSSTTNNWVGAIATFRAGCTGGSLTLAAPASSSFPSVTLNGTDKTATGSIVLTPDDESGTGSSWNGWNITGTSSTFSDGAGHILPTTAASISAATRSAPTGNCALPTNSITYPVTLPAGSTPPTAVKLYNAAANTGEGPTNVTLTTKLAVGANTYKGTYTSTWTFAIVSGP